ncbi:MAG: 6-hydroxycyclohex-1-ene-1-carbonyl-CoA dehydrogenase [Gammaproteobacteria bacterium]|nr:MAG: 6-hydroxycyclohex-1-ene-1-carbonyl-CoA dehydrogenase [Gammaproteobacteria bacterium]
MIAGRRWLMREAGRPLEEEAFVYDAPKAGEVTVVVAGCGVCHTDLGFFYDSVKTNHPLPLVLGHEISGRVVQTGADAKEWSGRSVIIPAVIPCGTCDLCRRGLANICRKQRMPGNDIQGGFASHITVPATGLCAVDPERLHAAGYDLAEVAVVADAVTTPYQAAVLAGITQGDVAIVIGVGGVGGYAVQIARAMGAVVVAIDVDQAKLDKLKAFGATLVLNSSEHEVRDMKKIINSFAADHGLRQTEWKIFECSGSAAGQTTAFGLLTYGAHIGVVGFTMAKTELRLSNLMAFNARMQGNWGCRPDLYQPALELVLAGKVQMKPFIKLWPLPEINAVFAAAHAHQLSERAILAP